MSPNFLRMSHTGTLPPMKLPEWITGSSGFVDQAERQRVLGVGMHHRHHVGPRLEDRRMDEAFQIRLALVVDRLALLIELDQVARSTSSGARERDMKKRFGLSGWRTLMWP